MVPTIMNPTSRGPIRIPIYTQVTLTVPIWMFPKIGVFPTKWMVKIMKNLIKMDDLGGKTPILETPISCSFTLFNRLRFV